MSKSIAEQVAQQVFELAAEKGRAERRLNDLRTAADTTSRNIADLRDVLGLPGTGWTLTDLIDKVRELKAQRDFLRNDATSKLARVRLLESRHLRDEGDEANAEFLLRTNAAVVWPVFEAWVAELRKSNGEHTDWWFYDQLAARMKNPHLYPPNTASANADTRGRCSCSEPEPADDGKRYVRRDTPKYRKVDGQWQSSGSNWQGAWDQDDSVYVEVSRE